ncbi:hypothetical protein B0H17DRAFT_1185307 [Mycena rosella]|uniref:Uncharacterized protein n=1 Tax=Mycena rosella TaxID=1033263 RepID=A0AAD7G2X5_MYCRO|nr:hypothetical protein B0H17DRAFT_1185307 [Mycena rosella]
MHRDIMARARTSVSCVISECSAVQCKCGHSLAAHRLYSSPAQFQNILSILLNKLRSVLQEDEILINIALVQEEEEFSIPEPSACSLSYCIPVRPIIAFHPIDSFHRPLFYIFYGVIPTFLIPAAANGEFRREKKATGDRGGSSSRPRWKSGPRGKRDDLDKQAPAGPPLNPARDMWQMNLW